MNEYQSFPCLDSILTYIFLHMILSPVYIICSQLFKESTLDCCHLLYSRYGKMMQRRVLGIRGRNCKRLDKSSNMTGQTKILLIVPFSTKFYKESTHLSGRMKFSSQGPCLCQGNGVVPNGNGTWGTELRSVSCFCFPSHSMPTGERMLLPLPASTSLGHPLDWLLPAAGDRPVPG